MSSKFNHQCIIRHNDLNASLGTNVSWVSTEDGFVSKIITGLTTTPVVVDYGSITTPKLLHLRLRGGSDVEISLDNGVTWQGRLSGVDDMTSIRLNIEASMEVSTVVVVADVGGDLGGKYFDLFDASTAVRFWFYRPAAAEVSQVVCVADVGGSLSSKYFVAQDAAGSVVFWFNITGADPAPSVPGAGRYVEIVSGYAGAPATDIASAIAGDTFAETALTIDWDGDVTITITDAVTGVRTAIAAGDAGMAVSQVTAGTATVAAPAAGSGSLHQVTYNSGATALTILGLTAAAVTASPLAVAVVTDGLDTLTVTDAAAGNRTDAAAGTSGFGVSTADGSAAPIAKVRSKGVSKVGVTVAPY